jgi:uncharacterized protein (DUF302 family)
MSADRRIALDSPCAGLETCDTADLEVCATHLGDTPSGCARPALTGGARIDALPPVVKSEMLNENPEKRPVHMSILYEKETKEGMDVVGRRLEEAVKAHKFGVITVVDLKAKMAEKGVQLDKACKVYEVCNPVQAKRVLDQNMSVATALPCRIAVYEENNGVKVATMLPTQMLALFSAPELAPVAQEVEVAIKAMIDEATQPK